MDIDVVVIGLNTSKTLNECLDSIRKSTYPASLVRVFYADGGSTDGSQEIAKAAGATVIEVLSEDPTPGKQRNAGWRAGSAPLVQFLDSDTILDPFWLDHAVAALVSPVVAVCGLRQERFPEASIFNWIGDQEWNGPAGPIEAFGGDVLVKREVLESSGGYDPTLIAGEDPELSFRIRKAGGAIVRLNQPMTKHDLAMHRLGQYWKRSYRTGHAYAEVNYLHRDRWQIQVKRILLRSGLFGLVLCSLLVALFWPWALGLTVFFAAAFLRPRLLLVNRFMNQYSFSRVQARIYAWHVSLVVLPQVLGMLRFHWGRWLSRPLSNRRVLKGVIR